MSRFQRGQQRDRTRVNHEIRVPRVRLVGPEGEAIGIVTTGDALAKAEETGFDLVEVAPNADPPVCRIMDYGKFKYEKSKKAKEAKKKQHVMHLKEIKLHPKTDDHDYRFKINHARDFLLRGDRVKVTLVFRGREITHIDFGRKILERAENDLQDIAQMEQSSKREGRNMISTFIPDKTKIKAYSRRVEQERKQAEREQQEQQKEEPSA
ncbi:MAG: translation initiation factor IF-3 [Chitinivibrionales bacterium]|nr:translation initiation factor IF-3 [Chitinivibrionales bacterium]MBD3394323.1 translation initiation factor IF-3 [Chitinivibrionales bacterium]